MDLAKRKNNLSADSKAAAVLCKRQFVNRCAKQTQQKGIDLF